MEMMKGGGDTRVYIYVKGTYCAWLGREKVTQKRNQCRLGMLLELGLGGCFGGV